MSEQERIEGNKLIAEFNKTVLNGIIMKKIKTAEEYANKYDNTVYSIVDVIKIAQLEMLEYAVNKCAKNAIIENQEKSPPEWHLRPSWGVNKQSILKTIDEIKEELK